MIILIALFGLAYLTWGVLTLKWLTEKSGGAAWGFLLWAAALVLPGAIIAQILTF